MIELQIPTLDEFLRIDIESEYFTTLNFAIKYADIFRKEKDNHNIGDITEKQFGLIKDYQYDKRHQLFFNEQIDYLIKFSNVKEIHGQSLDLIIQSINYIDCEINKLTEIENIKLAGHSSSDELIAAGDKFDNLGEYMQIRQLAGNDFLKTQEVRESLYSKAFLELYTCKQVSDFEKELHKIRNRK